MDLGLGVGIIRVVEISSHQSGKRGIPMKNSRIAQPLIPPLDDLACFQIRDGGKLMRGIGPVLFYKMPKNGVTGNQNDHGCYNSAEE
jgi:hypothetical protein